MQTQAGSLYGAISCQNGSAPSFYNCVVDSNYWGRVTIYNSNPKFRKCIFRDNQPPANSGLLPSEGPVVISVFSNPIFDSCTFLNNKKVNAGGVFSICKQ